MQRGGNGSPWPPATGLVQGAGAGKDAPAALLEECRHIVKRRLAPPLLELFRQATGLGLHACWHPPGMEVPPEELVKLCPKARRRPAGTNPARCGVCRHRRWQFACATPPAHSGFAGLCGSINYCASLKALDWCLLTLVVQRRPPVSKAKKTAFRHAVAFVRFILSDLEAALGSDGNAGKGPRPSAPLISQARKRLAGAHSRRKVEAMLNYIHEHYSRPLQLTDLAAALELNAAYVSDLFSTAVGVTFHRYLEEFRIAKAKELLRDPRKRVCEVARAVGYSNPNHFRNVFNARVGEPPSAWR
jgi:AraC-like DNA-binding protein